MAVLLVAVFPILLLINGPLAWVGVAVGILLLYRDNRRHSRPIAASRRPSTLDFSRL